MADNAPEPSFVMDDLDLSLNSLPLDMTGEVPLRVTAGVGATGTYTLDFENLAVLTGTCMYLEDKHTGVFTDLNRSFFFDGQRGNRCCIGQCIRIRQPNHCCN
jgi:hypothetical protein